MIIEPFACPKCGNKDSDKVAWRELKPHERKRAQITEGGKRGRL